MSEQDPDAPPQGTKADPPVGLPSAIGATSGLAVADVLTLILGIGWLGLCWAVLFGGRLPDGFGTDALTQLTVALLPVAMLWLVARHARRLRWLEAENDRLQLELSGLATSMRVQAQAHSAQPLSRPAASQPAGQSNPPPVPPSRPPSLPTSQPTSQPPRAEPDPDTGTDAPANAAPPNAEPDTEADQSALPLATALPVPETDAATLIRALNFPQTPQDSDGFAALRSARQDPQVAALLRAAEDVLTILSEDGLYMDDLTAPPPAPALWRRFAEGLRGPEIDALGTLRDPATLARASARMREDPIFRDAVLHFLQRFDRVVSRNIPRWQDADLAALSETRTARGFMLLARVAGSFD